MAKTYYVIAECVDVRDGSRYLPGAEFPDPTRDQVTRLTGAKCISEEKPDPAALASARDANDQRIEYIDDLGGKTLAQLQALAKAEEIDLGDATRKPETLAAIRKARQAKAA